MVLLVWEDEVFFAEDDGLDDELVFDELTLEEERKPLEIEVEVEVELDTREDSTLELINEEERLELGAAVEEVKLELIFLVDDAFELLLEEAEVLFDVDSVVGEETCEVGQRDGGYGPVSNVVTATVSVIAYTVEVSVARYVVWPGTMIVVCVGIGDTVAVVRPKYIA
jgi:hypothetical protein